MCTYFQQLRPKMLYKFMAHNTEKIRFYCCSSFLSLLSECHSISPLYFGAVFFFDMTLANICSNMFVEIWVFMHSLYNGIWNGLNWSQWCLGVEVDSTLFKKKVWKEFQQPARYCSTKRTKRNNSNWLEFIFNINSLPFNMQ